MDKLYTFNNRMITPGGNRVAGSVPGPTPPPGPSTLPSDMHFLYFANDFANGYIPNRATNSTIGNYSQEGTLVKNGSGANCYLSNGLSDSNYLYVYFGDADLDLMKGVDNVYTFYCRVMQTSGGTGGIFSWRMDGGYVYMIRCEGNDLQIHWFGGQDTDLSLTIDTVYKITIDNDIFTATNMLNTSSTWSGDANLYGTREMSTEMTTFHAGYPGEAFLDRMYALAGIARATTAAEDTAITNALMNQTV